MKTLEYKDYLDKIHGGWFGKCLGGAAGAPVEGIKSKLDVTARDIINPALPNDDLDLQLLWLEQLEKKGPWLTSMDLAEAWKNQCWYPFGEYGYFLKNYELGIYPPLSGSHNNKYFYDGMGCPIRSEIWGMVFAGDPAKAVEMAKKDACLDHTDNSYWAEVFLCALESMAFFKKDLPDLIRKALEFVEEDCRFRRCISMILDSREAGEDFAKIMRKIQIDYSHPDFTNSVQNLGYTVLALLFGGNDMESVINYALQCGYDADCTCATAGAITGIMNGFDAQPNDLKVLLDDQYVIGIDVVRRDNSITSLAQDTCNVGLGISALSDSFTVTGVPETIEIPSWPSPSPGLIVSVSYPVRPVIGFKESCLVELSVTNDSIADFNGAMSIDDLPEGWSITEDTGSSISRLNLPLYLAPGESRNIRALFTVSPEITTLHQKNLISAVFTSEQHSYRKNYIFGIAGSLLWYVNGPFIEPREYQVDSLVPPCHGSESTLPSLETIFANMAIPDKEYLDETAYVSDPAAFDFERAINSYEDLIPVEENFGLHGEATFYLYTDIWFREAGKTWLVIGNSDAFKIWINGELTLSVDESRFWQPHCHSSIIDMKKGNNRIILKLTRRTSPLKFSLGLRGNEKRHYHHQTWRTDFAGLDLRFENIEQ